MFIVYVELSQIDRGFEVCVTDELDLIDLLQIFESSEDISMYQVISSEGIIEGPDRLNYVYDGLTFEKWK
jgi:hypothetical protein